MEQSQWLEWWEEAGLEAWEDDRWLAHERRNEELAGNTAFAGAGDTGLKGSQRWKRVKELEEDLLRKEKKHLEEKDRDLKVRSEQLEDMMFQMKQMQKMQLGQQEVLRGLIQSQAAPSTASSSAGHPSGLEQSQPEGEGGLKKANTKNPP